MSEHARPAEDDSHCRRPVHITVTGRWQLTVVDQELLELQAHRSIAWGLPWLEVRPDDLPAQDAVSVLLGDLGAGRLIERAAELGLAVESSALTAEPARLPEEQPAQWSTLATAHPRWAEVPQSG